jgi:hypothetical protein
MGRKIRRCGLFRIRRKFRSLLRRNITKLLRRPRYLGLCYRETVPKLGKQAGNMATLLWQLREASALAAV